MLATILSIIPANWLVGIIGGSAVIGYIYSLYYRYQRMVEQNAAAKTQAKLAQDTQAVTQETNNVKESVRDYNSAVDNFTKNNPS